MAGRRSGGFILLGRTAPNDASLMQILDSMIYIYIYIYINDTSMIHQHIIIYIYLYTHTYINEISMISLDSTCFN